MQTKSYIEKFATIQDVEEMRFTYGISDDCQSQGTLVISVPGKRISIQMDAQIKAAIREYIATHSAI